MHDEFRAKADKIMVQIARNLRQRETPSETIMWEVLRNRRVESLKFRRQHPIANTAFVVDFLCYEVKLIIEIDGGIHKHQVLDDKIRQELISEQGFNFMRFTNNQIQKQLDNVIVEILIFVNSHKIASISQREDG